MSLSSVLVTGSAGFLGQALVSTLAEAGLRVHGLDVVGTDGIVGSARPAEMVVGDVSDAEVVARACEGQDALVIAHMAPNKPGVYGTATLPFDINVKGAALLFEQAVKRAMKRVVLISSISVVDGHRGGGLLTRDLPPRPVSLYGLTKVCQEEIAAYHHRINALPVSVLRPAYVTDADTMTDKYGRQRPSVNWQCVDRRDVAGAAAAALLTTAPAFGIYYVHGHPDAPTRMETGPTATELGWTPRHDFGAYPTDGG